MTTLESYHCWGNIILTKWLIKVIKVTARESRAEQVLILTMIIKLSSRSPPGKSDGWAEGGITDGLDLDLDLDLG